MNLNLPHQCEKHHPFKAVKGLERLAIIVAMNHADDIGLYIHDKAVFESVSGIEEQVFLSAIQKFISIRVVIQFNDEYWFRDYISMNCGAGDKLIKNKILSTLLTKIHKSGMSEDMEEAVMQRYPELRYAMTEIRKGREPASVVAEIRSTKPAYDKPVLTLPAPKPEPDPDDYSEY